MNVPPFVIIMRTGDLFPQINAKSVRMRDIVGCAKA